eukprot:4723646-Karenia_brevis.AAC.1
MAVTAASADYEFAANQWALMIIQQPGAHTMIDSSIHMRPYTTGIYRRDPIETIPEGPLYSETTR